MSTTNIYIQYTWSAPSTLEPHNVHLVLRDLLLFPNPLSAPSPVSKRRRLHRRPPRVWRTHLPQSSLPSPLSRKYTIATDTDSSGPDLPRRSPSHSEAQETFSSTNRPACRTVASQIPARSDPHGKKLQTPQTRPESDETSPATDTEFRQKKSKPQGGWTDD